MVAGIGAALALGWTGAAVAAAAPGEPVDPDRYIVVLEGSVDHPGEVADRHEAAYGAEPDAVYRHALDGYVAEVPGSELAELRADPKVAFVVRDRVFAHLPKPPPETVPCEEVEGLAQCLPDAIDRIEADRSSARSGDGRGKERVNVAIIDTGIDIDHPDLNVAGGVDCSTGSPVADPALYDDYFGHGTFVGGVVGAKDNRIGVVGVAPGTPLWAVQTDSGEEFISESAMICGVDWVTSTLTDRNKRNDISVANMSLIGEADEQFGDDGNCGRTRGDPLHLAFCRSVGAGVTHVVAAGNDGGDIADYIPAGYDEVLTATAMADFDGRPGGKEPPDCWGFDYGEFGEFDDEVVPWSHFAITAADQRHVIAAPGDCVDSTIPLEFGNYGVSDGTSFSAPAVAGTAALCIARGKCHGPHQTMHRLLKDARAYNLTHPNYGFLGDPLNPIGPEYYGYLINAGIY